MRKETSTNFENEKILNDYCNASKNLRLINGRWKLPVLYFLFKHESAVFSDFKKLLPSASDRMLALHLREMITDDLIEKIKEDNIVIYRTTVKALSMKKLLLSFAELKLELL